MLYDFGGKLMKHMVHRKQFEYLSKKLTTTEKGAIELYINKAVESEPKGYAVSSWIGAKHWAGTPLEAISIKISRERSISSMVFGAFVWKVIMERRDEWYYVPKSKDDEDVSGLRYFRKGLRDTTP